MILLPILFLYFIYRMQQYKHGRTKFDREFMITRQRALEIAVDAVEQDKQADVDSVVRQSSLPDPLREPYKLWVAALTEYYMDLLSATGDTFQSLVRSAYGNSANYLLALNRLGTAERQFYSALKPQLTQTEGAVAVISLIEEQSHQLRRELANTIFA